MNDDDLIRHLRGTEPEVVLLTTVVGEHLGDNTSSAGDAADELEGLGLVTQIKSLGGSQIEPTGRGRRIAERIQQSRQSGEDRWDAVAREVIAALLSGDVHAWRVKEVDGKPVTDAQMSVVINWLEKWGCAKAHRASGATGREVVRLQPRDRIHEVEGVHGLLRDYFEGVPGGGSVDQSTHATTTVHGNAGGVQTGGTGNVQTVIITTSQRAEILERLQHVREEMGEDAAPELVQAVEAIEAEAQSETATKESFRQRVETALLTATTNAAGTAVVSGLVSLLPAALGF